MNYIKNIFFSNKKYVIYATIFMLIIIFSLLFKPSQEEFLSLDSNSMQDDNVYESDNTEFTTIFVHIDGEVHNPGIKEVSIGTRVFELIDISGGLTENADISRLNLASILKDEQKIFVPSKVIPTPEIAKSVATPKLSSSTNASFTKYPININYATSAELQALNGIGPSMASKIISYREENGLFNTIEDIKNVVGIGEAKFSKIKDDIVVY